MVSVRQSVAAVVGLAFLIIAGSASADPAQCKKQCTANYNACLGSRAEDVCRKAWIQCKTACNPKPLTKTPPPTGSTPRPNGAR